MVRVRRVEHLGGRQRAGIKCNGALGSHVTALATLGRGLLPIGEVLLEQWRLSALGVAHHLCGGERTASKGVHARRAQHNEEIRGRSGPRWKIGQQHEGLSTVAQWGVRIRNRIMVGKVLVRMKEWKSDKSFDSTWMTTKYLGDHEVFR